MICVSQTPILGLGGKMVGCVLRDILLAELTVKYLKIISFMCENLNLTSSLISSKKSEE